MKHLLALSTVILAATGMPTGIGNNASNASFTNSAELAGFGANTIGGQGGPSRTVWDPWALRDALDFRGSRIVYIRGPIDMTPLFTTSPGVVIRVGSFKSIIGIDNAEILGGGLRVSDQVDVIIQNIKFTNIMSYGPGERPDGNGGIINQQPGAFSVIDAIDLDGSERIWIDHCEFSDDPWNSATIGENQRRHDGLVDMKQGASWISISNSIFRNHNLVSLVGHSDSNESQDTNRLRVTFYLNWFRGTVQRNPRVRYGQVHMLNNLYTDIISYGIGIGAGARIYAEGNVFVNCSRGWGFASGVPNPEGHFVNDNNRLVNSGYDGNIPFNANWHPRSFYSYNPMAVDNVEAHVRTNAGTR